MIYTDITLFNRYVSNHEAFYQRTYLYKVEWGEPSKRFGAPPSFSTQITIPFAQTQLYRSPKEWVLGKTGYWTLQPEDIIAKGIVSAEIASITDLYGNYSLTDMKKVFDLVTIISLSLNNASISQQKFTIGAS
jgi:hypothetical protein